MWKLLLPLVMLLTGCAAQVRSSSERSVTVWSPASDTGLAQAAADIECEKYGRKARMAMQLKNSNFLFDCER